MAISSCPTPAEAGVLYILLANTAISISVVKGLICSMLHIIGIHIHFCEELSMDSSATSSHYRKIPSESYLDEFRARTPMTLYNSNCFYDCQSCECAICLTSFQSGVEINHLSCDHIFHRACIENWLSYWNTTCPLCRDELMSCGPGGATFSR